MLENIPSLFGEPIPPYFALLILGFAAATYFGVRFALQMRLDKEVVIDLGLYALIAGVAGGRILHVFADGYFWDYVHLCTDPTKVIWKITRAECIDAEGYGIRREVFVSLKSAIASLGRHFGAAG